MEEEKVSEEFRPTALNEGNETTFDEKKEGNNDEVIYPDDGHTEEVKSEELPENENTEERVIESEVVDEETKQDAVNTIVYDDEEEVDAVGENIGGNFEMDEELFDSEKNESFLLKLLCGGSHKWYSIYRIAHILIVIEWFHTIYLFLVNAVLHIYFMIVVAAYKPMQLGWVFNLIMLLLALIYPCLCPILGSVKPFFFRGYVDANVQGKANIAPILILIFIVQCLVFVLLSCGGFAGMGLYQMIFTGIHMKNYFFVVFLFVCILLFFFSWGVHLILVALHFILTVLIFRIEKKLEIGFDRLEDEEDSEYGNM